MGKVIAVANHKGGVGKTSLVVGLADALTKEGRRVLLVDLDSQANLTSFYLKDNDNRPTIYESFSEGKPIPIFPAGRLDVFYEDGQLRDHGLVDNWKNMHKVIVPASLDLALIEDELVGKPAWEWKLKKMLAPVRDFFDYILLDCSPFFGKVSANAFSVADGILVPVSPSRLALKGLNMVAAAAAQLQEAHEMKTPVIAGIVLNMINRRSESAEVEEFLKQSPFGHLLFASKIRDSKSVLQLQAVSVLQNKTAAMEDFTALAKEFISKI